jgi:hypothetical protein
MNFATEERGEHKGARVCDPLRPALHLNVRRLTEPRSAEVSLRSLCSFVANKK